MLKLKSKIVKSDFLKEASLHSIKRYSGSWMGALRSGEFMEGVKYAVKQLTESKNEVK